MSGYYGIHQFGLEPYGIGAGDLTGEPPNVYHSSRATDFVTGELLVDDEGNFIGMDDIQQTIGLLIKYGVTEPKLIGNDFASALERDVRTVLAPLVNARLITIESFTVDTETQPGTVFKELEYKVLTTNTKTSVKF